MSVKLYSKGQHPKPAEQGSDARGKPAQRLRPKLELLWSKKTLSCEKGSLKALMVCQAEALKNFGPGSSTQSMVCYSAYRGKFFNVLMTDSQISAYTHFYH
ncbi:hypothetical protein Y1Q_0021503 [Alligator mississippiensis]|uniref:Uncharacterized protein n=1 Tax=Alligator mississippiensis TaxID=8496 RepID=A0A151PA67_ALLMI|nr:hypothetical protein Y1Q_0021503 [Alligator mississippiensis]